MAKLVLNDITNIDTALNDLNNNFSLIEQAFENTVSRDGTAPNQMTADLDFNSNSGLNVSELIVGGVGLSESVTNAATSAVAAAISELNAATSASTATTAASTATTAAGNLVDLEYRGTWTTATEYFPNNIIYYSTDGASYICLINHLSHATDFTIDLGAGRWGKLADRGAAGAGTGDMLKSENLSGLANYATARANMGLTIGTDVQEYDAQLTDLSAIASADNLVAIAGVTSAANKVPRFTGAGTAEVIDVVSGTFTSTATAISNCASATGGTALYSRVGNMVTVSGYGSCTTGTSAIFSVILTLTLPIASSFVDTINANGTMSANENDKTFAGVIGAYPSTDTVQLVFNSTEISSLHTFRYIYQYQII